VTAEEKRRRVSEFEMVRGYPWYHTIDLGDGIITPGNQDCQGTLRRIEIPIDLAGSTVLDIGCNDGFFSFECERRGAKVTAFDTFPETAIFCKEILGSGINVFKADLMEWETDETFDLVLFMGVLYHLRHPFLGIEKVRSLCHGDFILESHTADIGGSLPAMRMYPGKELAGDASNWWGPNVACIYAMLNDVGFKEIRVRSKVSDRVCMHARVGE
jgi:tRNA (mo5U34)-methyltransferase